MNRPRTEGYTLLEMTAAMTLAAILVGVFYSAMHRIRDLETLAMEQGRALIVLENAVERLAAEPMFDMDRAERILAAEFAASELSIPGRYAAGCDPMDGGFRMQVLRADGSAVAAVEVRP